MEEWIISWLNHTFGVTVAATVVIIGLALWLTYYVTKRVTEIRGSHSLLSATSETIKNDFNEIRKDISYLKGSVKQGEKVLNEIRQDVNSLKVDVGALKVDVNNLKSEMGCLKSESGDTKRKIDHVMNAISCGPTSSAVGLIQSHSPISLTEEGRNVARKINAEEIIDKCWSTIKGLIDENVGCNSAYDIQKYCIETSAIFPEKFYDEESLNSLKDHAYNAGVQLSRYTEMMGIIIRDRYLKECDIAIEEVDKTDPSKSNINCPPE